jgi:catechol 2,3-dioxygenase-like lactoylglutathione lyase family enzyme
MIRGVHTMLYTSEPESLRAFIREKLDLPAYDVGGGWLIFDLPEADLGCHPNQKENGQLVPSGTPHISFYCDNIYESVAMLKARGVEFEGDVQDHGYGLVTHFRVPGGFSIQLYQPRYVKGKPLAKAPLAAETRERDRRGASKKRAHARRTAAKASARKKPKRSARPARRKRGRR